MTSWEDVRTRLERELLALADEEFVVLGEPEPPRAPARGLLRRRPAPAPTRYAQVLRSGESWYAECVGATSFGGDWDVDDTTHRRMRDAGRPTKSLESTLWHKLSGPLSAVLMPLLGAVAAFGIARSGQLFVRAVIGMALGFAYFVADNFALAMGNLGAYPPFLAAWAPFLLFLMVGEAVLVRTEE